MISLLFKYDTLNSMSSSSVPEYWLGTQFSNRRVSFRLVFLFQTMVLIVSYQVEPRCSPGRNKQISVILDKLLDLQIVFISLICQY